MQVFDVRLWFRVKSSLYLLSDNYYKQESISKTEDVVGERFFFSNLCLNKNMRLDNIRIQNQKMFCEGPGSEESDSHFRSVMLPTGVENIKPMFSNGYNN